MSETNTQTTTATASEYILYRTVDYKMQPPAVTNTDGTTTTPPPVIAERAGTVIARMLLNSSDGVSAPNGFAFIEDSAGAYPIGSIYSPPAS